MSESVIDRLSLTRIVPVVEITDPARAAPLARVLADAGLPVMEVTLRTSAAIDSISAIHDAMPDFLVGAGTLLTPAQVHVAANAGARFGVSPGFSPELSKAASDLDLPFVPGAVTASEIIAAAQLGHSHLKFFPAEQSGGVALIRSFASPFSRLGIRFMPTGGVNLSNLDDYLLLSNVFAVGGTWIAPRHAIRAGDFNRIGAAARATVAHTAVFQSV